MLGRDAVAVKPIASGLEHGINEDLTELASAADHVLLPEDLNCYCFEPAIAPHRAAELAQARIEIAPIFDAWQRVAAQHGDVLVEGVGGVSVPLGPALMLADLAQALSLPLILVVGIRLGCINHALLSALAIRSAGLNLHGWVANLLDPAMREPEASIGAIEQRIEAPLLGRLEFNADAGSFGRLALALIESSGNRAAAP